MEGKYDVFLGDKVVGTVQVKREGLYYHFSCQCRLEGDVSKLRVTCGGKQENLGVLIPLAEGFGLDTKLPVKRLGEGRPEFRVIPNRAVLAGRFVPISPEEPFAYIGRLKDAYLARQDGQVGVVIQEPPGK